MKVIVCGAGRVGFGIARELAKEGHSVTVVDVAPSLIEQVTTDLDVRGVVGYGSHPDVLERAGASAADMIVAATYSDEVNMVACQVAHSLFKTPTKIARIRGGSYLDLAWRDLFNTKHLPVDLIISPEMEVAKTVLRRLETPGAYYSAPFLDGRVRLLAAQIEEDSALVSTTDRQNRELFPDLKARLVGVKRERRVFVPRPDDAVIAGDAAYWVADEAHVGRLLDLVGKRERQARRVVIIGGGNIGAQVARDLEARANVRVRIIEIDKARAERTADQLRRTVVLNGDGMSARILREAGVRDAEVVACLTNDDRVNVLAAVMAKQEGAKRSVCLVNDRALAPMKAALGVDVFIDPRSITVSTILTQVRRGRILALQTLEDGEAEALEAIALETSPLANKRISEMADMDGLAVGAVLRKDEVLIPDRNFLVRPGDRLVVFAEREMVGAVEKLFRVSLEYF
ncbi:MAG: Trk system potassium transporter TrkA [Maricaulaceae bacterium]